MTKYGFIPPVMLSIFFILSLYSRNISLVSTRDVLPPLLISISISILLYLVYYSRKEFQEKAVILSTIMIGMVFSFGYSLFIPLALIPLAIFVLAKNKPYINFTIPLIIVITCIAMVPIIQIARYHIASPSERVVVESSPQGTYPDIYYIIPDSYAGDKTLESLGYDNSEFSNFLKEKGFYLTEDTHCNYTRTYLSLLSTLNMNYLQSTDCDYCRSQIGEDTEVVKYLKSKGYYYIHIGSSMWEVTRSNKYADKVFVYEGQSTEFLQVVINTTPMREVWKEWGLRELARENILYQMEILKSPQDSSSPKFVFCHLLLPHHVHVSFNPDGSFPTEKELETRSSEDKYFGQVSFLNSQLEIIVTSILNESENPPIIVIQSDEGSSLREYPKHVGYLNEELVRERGYIFSAYYLPGSPDILYPGISPVNIFRVIFNEYFNENFELLPDKLYLPKIPADLETGDPTTDYYDATGMLR